jgi:anti-sigma factor RsiW
MTCEHLALLLEDYHAGALPDDEAARLEQHLLSCEACRAEFRFQRSLRLEAAALPRGVRPASNLWPGIQHRLTSRPASLTNRAPAPWWHNRWLLAAAAVLLVIVASSVTAIVLRPRVSPPRTASTAGQFATTEAAYREAANDLAAALERRRANLAPEQVAVIERNLKIIDDAIRESEAALAEHPGNQRIMELLWGSYEKKIDLLQRASSNVES